MNIPCDSTTPAFVQVMQWIINPLAVLQRSQQRYGDLFSLPIEEKFKPLIFVSHPDAIREVLRLDTPDETNKFLEPTLGQYSVFTLNGNAHHRQRQLLLPPFHGERMRAYGQAIVDIAKQAASGWQFGKPFAVQPEMSGISMRIILHTVFGVEGTRFQALNRLLTVFMKELKEPLSVIAHFFPILQQDFGSLSPWTTFLRYRQQIDTLIYQEIQSRRDHPDPSRTDILALLMTAQDEQGRGMTDIELRDELITLLTAGYETTSTALAWALYWIHKLPDVKNKLLQEIATLAENPDPIEVSRLPYLKAVCHETLRIYPTVLIPLTRQAHSTCNLSGYSIESGARLTACIHLLHRRDDLYPEPTLFKPERFLQRQFSPYEFIPFGGGNRRCIGMAFAQFQMQLILATILTQVNLTLVTNRPVQPVFDGVIIAPSTLKMAVTGASALKK